MLELPMQMPGGHLIIRHNALSLLVNTGCPVSMGTRPSLLFPDREIPVLERYHGVTVPQWGEIIGVHIDGLLGSDVLGRYAVAIDPEAARVTFDGKRAARSRARVAPLSVVAGLPVIDVGLGGRRMRVLLHTGATLSCLRDVDTKDYPCVGVVRDCYPGLGEFTTELRRVPLSFGDQPVHLECGLIPAELERALRAVGVSGVVGTNLLQDFALAWGPHFSDLGMVARRTVDPPIHPAADEMPRPIAYRPLPSYLSP